MLKYAFYAYYTGYQDHSYDNVLKEKKNPIMYLL